MHSPADMATRTKSHENPVDTEKLTLASRIKDSGIVRLADPVNGKLIPRIIWIMVEIANRVITNKINVNKGFL